MILASGSPYRRDLLLRLGVEFEVAVPAVDETLAPGEPPAEAVLRLARLKAAAVAARRPDAIVLAGDQLAELAGRALGKPRDPDDAARMLTLMSGRTVNYHTAIAVLGPDLADPLTHVDASRVSLRALEPEEVRRYLERENALDCAGALRLEGLAAGLCEKIETQDPAALIGLPLIATADLLRRCRYRIP